MRSSGFGNAEAFGSDVVTSDPLAASADAAAKGVAQPVQAEMRCVFDAMNTGVRDMFAGSNDFAAPSAAMQSSADTCISQLQPQRPRRMPGPRPTRWGRRTP